jgi:hypothetical protein
VEAWRVQDTGLVAAPGPFRRLPGSAVRHLRGEGPLWPARVALELDDRELRVSGDGLTTPPLFATCVVAGLVRAVADASCGWGQVVG